MMFLKESMYGWGVCNIPQPRASQDIFADRGKSSGACSPAGRRLAVAGMGAGALWASFLRRDLPGVQVLAVLSFSLAMILGIWGGSLLLPEVTAEQEPPLEIMARLPEEPLPKPEPIVADPAKPVPAPVPPAPKVATVPHPKPPKPLPPEPKITPPPKIVVAQPVKAEPVVLPTPRTVARQYRDAAPTKALLPAGKPADTLTFDKQNEVVQPRPLDSGRRYAMTGETTSLPKRQAYAAARGGTEMNLPAAAGLKRNFQLPRVRQSRAASARECSFVPGGDAPGVAIRGTQGVSGNLLEDSPDNTASVALPGQADRSVGDRVGIVGGNEEVELPTIVGVAGQGDGVATAASAASAAGPDVAGGSVSFGNLDQGNIDPSRIISLNDLRACIDPGAEAPLKTELAVALEENGSCALRDMVFFYRNPEDRYTLWVGVYNPENFTDRCEALKAALECVHLKQ